MLTAARHRERLFAMPSEQYLIHASECEARRTLHRFEQSTSIANQPLVNITICASGTSNNVGSLELLGEHTVGSCDIKDVSDTLLSD